MNIESMAASAVEAALEKKAKRLVMLDLKGASAMCDMQFICSGDNDRQTKAIAEAISAKLKEANIMPNAVEGRNSGNWILLDYGPLMVHVFFDYVRDYYAIEGLWPEAEFLDVQELIKNESIRH